MFEPLARKRVQYAGYAIIALGAVVLAFWVGGRKPGVAKKTNQVDATTTGSTSNSPGSGAVSYGQTGGVTAQTYNDNSVIQYFVSQPQDEKDKWRQYLTKQYPLGWGMYAADGRTIYTPRGLSYERDFLVIWDTQRVTKLTAESVSLQAPNIFLKRNRGTITGFETTLKRQTGATKNLIKHGQVCVVAEFLKDEGDFVVFAVGFRQADSSEPLPAPSGSQRTPAKTP